MVVTSLETSQNLRKVVPDRILGDADPLGPALLDLAFQIALLAVVHDDV